MLTKGDFATGARALRMTQSSEPEWHTGRSTRLRYMSMTLLHHHAAEGRTSQTTIAMNQAIEFGGLVYTRNFVIQLGVNT